MTSATTAKMSTRLGMGIAGGFVSTPDGAARTSAPGSQSGRAALPIEATPMQILQQAPEWATLAKDLILILIGGGGGGLAALWRIRSQNKVDEATQLSKEQRDFREAMRAELTELRTRLARVEHDKDVVEAQAAEQKVQIVRLEEADRYKRAQLDVQAAEIKDLREENIRLKEKFALAEEERAKAVEQAKIAQDIRTFLETENATLREENSRLRAKLPLRVESPEAAA